MLRSLYPFQLRGITYCLQKQGRCIIADEMGLGKTIQAIGVAACYRTSDWPLLVICPSSVRMNWRQEFVKWLGICPLKISIIENSKDRADGEINIISYDLVPRLEEEIASRVSSLLHLV